MPNFQALVNTDLVKVFERLSELKRVKSLHAPYYSLASNVFLDTTRLLSQMSDSDQLDKIMDWMVVRGLVYSVVGDWREDLLPPNFLAQRNQTTLDLLEYALSDCPIHLKSYYLENYPQLISTFENHSLDINAASDRWLTMLCQTTRSGYAGTGLVKCIPSPSESEAEHSVICALISAMLCRAYGESPGMSCTIALFHHLRCLAIPNSDHEADAVLASWGEQIRDYTHAYTVSTFPPFLRKVIEDAFKCAGKGFHGDALHFFEADIIDRTLQLNYYSRMKSLTASDVMSRYDYFNQEPLKSFQIAVLSKFGLC